MASSCRRLLPIVILRVVSVSLIHFTKLRAIAGNSEASPLAPSVISLPTDHIITDGAFLEE